MRPLAPILAFVGVLSWLPAGHAAEPEAFAGVVERSITRFIRPGYERLAGAAETMAIATERLCGTPATPALDEARARFTRLVETWSQIELIRFGPARQDNRHERLFFWPDRRSLGLRQVQRVLSERDESAVVVESLKSKSVALQGLGALEFVLFGTGSQELVDTGKPDAYRCAYGRAIAGAIHSTADELAAAWRDETGYAGSILEPGGEGAAYQDHGEAVQDLVQAMGEMLQFVQQAKLAPALGQSIDEAKPKRAPLWRSDLTLVAIKANIRSVLRLFADGGFAEVLDDDGAWVGQQIELEIGQALGALERFEGRFVEAVREKEQYGLLKFSGVGINGATSAITNDYMALAGLGFGFNALDGD